MVFGYGMPRHETPLSVWVFGTIFVIIALLLVSLFVVAVVQGLRNERRNNQSPTLVIEAVVVSKRQDISRSREHLSTYYYATFEAETGSRMEFELSGEEFGLLAEGDRGRLTFQGTRYLGFQRC